jgi:hypothetical protein
MKVGSWTMLVFCPHGNLLDQRAEIGSDGAISLPEDDCIQVRRERSMRHSPLPDGTPSPRKVRSTDASE